MTMTDPDVEERCEATLDDLPPGLAWFKMSFQDGPTNRKVPFSFGANRIGNPGSDAKRWLVTEVLARLAQACPSWRGLQ